MDLKASNSLERMLRVIDVVDMSQGAIQFDDMYVKLGFTRSTLYRYLKTLTDSGFLISVPDLGYTLGPRITELDFKMRQWDPLISAARPVMLELVASQSAVALLCRRYRAKVLCVHQERGTSALQSNYERGRARPLLRGAASRIILANLPSQLLSRLYQEQQADFKDAKLGSTLAEVKGTLKKIRQTGWDMTHGQLTPGVTGIAAPLIDGRGSVIGSLSLTIDRPTKLDEKSIEKIADRVQFCAGIIMNSFASKGA
jgi:DNA-binding IclR family transcriptional regulator